MNKYWTQEKCIESAKKFKTRAEWRKYEGAAYSAAVKMKILYLCTEHFETLSSKWTLEDCQREALKYEKRIDWQLKHQSTYHFAWKKRWLHKCCTHMK